MTHNRLLPSIAVEDGPEAFRSVLALIDDEGWPYEVYKDKESRGTGHAPQAMLVPMTIWREYEEQVSHLSKLEILTTEQGQVESTFAQQTVDLHHARQAIAQTHTMERQPRIEAVRLALQAMEQTSGNITNGGENLIVMAEAVHTFITKADEVDISS